ncbi:hypothetical protein KW805_01085 [Candidatus Pacearchaeota archaeon]|nr:hypothetical protein [Candidatus Pacearchaeota archaeon]
MNTKPITTQKDLDSLHVGDVVDFVHDRLGTRIKKALYIGETTPFYSVFRGRRDGNIVELEIKKSHLSPRNGKIDIQERVTIPYHEFLPKDTVDYDWRDDELREYGL